MFALPCQSAGGQRGPGGAGPTSRRAYAVAGGFPRRATIWRYRNRRIITPMRRGGARWVTVGRSWLYAVESGAVGCSLEPAAGGVCLTICLTPLRRRRLALRLVDVPHRNLSSPCIAPNGPDSVATWLARLLSARCWGYRSMNGRSLPSSRSRPVRSRWRLAPWSWLAPLAGRRKLRRRWWSSRGSSSPRPNSRPRPLGSSSPRPPNRT